MNNNCTGRNDRPPPDSYSLKNDGASSHPVVAFKNNILVILRELILIPQAYHGSIQDVSSVITRNNKHLRTKHHIIADNNIGSC